MTAYVGNFVNGVSPNNTVFLQCQNNVENSSYFAPAFPAKDHCVEWQMEEEGMFITITTIYLYIFDELFNFLTGFLYCV